MARLLTQVRIQEAVVLFGVFVLVTTLGPTLVALVWMLREAFRYARLFEQRKGHPPLTREELFYQRQDDPQLEVARHRLLRRLAALIASLVFAPLWLILLRTIWAPS